MILDGTPSFKGTLDWWSPYLKVFYRAKTTTLLYMTFRSYTAMRFLTHLTKKLDPVSSIISRPYNNRTKIFCAFFRAPRASIPPSANEQTSEKRTWQPVIFTLELLRLVDRIEDQKLAFCCVEFFFSLFFTAEMSKEPVIKHRAAP